MNLLNLFKQKLSSLDIKIIQLISLQLDELNKNKIKKQIELLKFKKSMNDKDVSFFDRKTIKEDLKFINKKSELLAILYFKENNNILKVEVEIFNGLLSNIIYYKPPKNINSFTLSDILIFNNLNQENIQINKKDLNNKYLSIITKETKLPQDYINIINENKLYSFNNFKIFNDEEIIRVVYPESNYYGIAENPEEGLLCLKFEDKDGYIYLFKNDSDYPIVLEKSLIDSIKKINTKT